MYYYYCFGQDLSVRIFSKSIVFKKKNCIPIIAILFNICVATEFECQTYAAAEYVGTKSAVNSDLTAEMLIPN